MSVVLRAIGPYMPALDPAGCNSARFAGIAACGRICWQNARPARGPCPRTVLLGRQRRPAPALKRHLPFPACHPGDMATGGVAALSRRGAGRPPPPPKIGAGNSSAPDVGSGACILPHRCVGPPLPRQHGYRCQRAIISACRTITFGLLHGRDVDQSALVDRRPLAPRLGRLHRRQDLARLGHGRFGRGEDLVGQRHLLGVDRPFADHAQRRRPPRLRPEALVIAEIAERPVHRQDAMRPAGRDDGGLSPSARGRTSTSRPRAACSSFPACRRCRWSASPCWPRNPPPPGSSPASAGWRPRSPRHGRSRPPIR